MNYRLSEYLLLTVFCWLFSYSLVYGQSWKLTADNIAGALENASEKIKGDPLRPAFHLTPPAGCMGDPNGGIYHNGWYHIFYGLQPFSGDFGGWYWAHAKTRDFLDWQHLPPGLTPAFQFGLNAVGSGSTVLTEEGKTLAFYSSSINDTMAFWRAEMSADLNTWRHTEKNPVVTLQQSGLPDYDVFFRDPFVFRAGGRTLMIACADLFDENYVSVPVFEAKNPDFTDWEYKGILFTWPKHEFRNFEVPEIHPLGDKWVFLASCDAPVDRTLYLIGEFDPEILRFMPRSQGFLDYSGHYYAQEAVQDDQGNLFLMAWIPGWDRPWMPNFRPSDRKNRKELWNGCFALPRKLSIDSEGTLIQQPVISLKHLRSQPVAVESRQLPVVNAAAAIDVLKNVRGNQLELQAEFELGAASFCGLNVLCDDHGNGGMTIMWSGDMINIDGVQVPMPEWTPGQPLHLRIFIDKQIVEVFINGGVHCVSRQVQIDYIKGDRIALTRLGGHAVLKSLKAWTLKSLDSFSQPVTNADTKPRMKIY